VLEVAELPNQLPQFARPASGRPFPADALSRRFLGSADRWHSRAGGQPPSPSPAPPLPFPSLRSDRYLQVFVCSLSLQGLGAVGLPSALGGSRGAERAGTGLLMPG